MRPIPVLHVLHHSPWYFRDPSRPMDAQSMTDDWHVRSALALQRAFPGRFALECWRPDWREPREKTVNVEGLTCRVFPSRPAPLGRFSYEVSLPMLAALRRKALRKRFLTHVHEMHSAFGMLAALLPAGALLVAHTHGTPPVGLRLAQGRPLAKRIPLRLFKPLEDLALARYRHLFAIADRELAYLQSLSLPASKLTMGVDFEAFRPGDRLEARRRLNLPEEARIVFYAGRFFALKGVGAMLEAFEEVRRREPRAFLMMAGGLPQDDLYAQTLARADLALARIPSKDLPGYLAAADLCLVNASDPGLLGIGMAAVEAWAMDRPVVTSALGEYPGPQSRRQALGVLHRPGQDDLAESILRGLELAGQGGQRTIARPVYDWPVIAASMAEVYERVWRQ